MTSNTTTFDSMNWITQGVPQPEKLSWVLSADTKNEMLARYHEVASIYNKSQYEVIDLWLLASKDAEDRAARYDQIADLYDTFTSSVGVMDAAEVAAGYVAKYVPKEARILDIGAGTGAMGYFLYHHQGYRNLEALDISPGMLEEARKKNVYKALHRKELGVRWDFPDGAFDAVTCINMLPDPTAVSVDVVFDEPIRLAKKGGHIVFTLVDMGVDKLGYTAKLAELQDAGLWQSVDISEKVKATDGWTKELTPRTYVYRVL
ncbi:MAG: class I SAM-dependent DNA methyltransferase [Gammaproteobacteria bacterium]